MATSIVTRQNMGGLEVIFSLITSLIRRVQHLIKVISGKRTISREIAEFEKAVRTVQLAAEPGENYAEVAAKLKREAALYRDFLLNPQQPIGRISLFVKELNPHERDFGEPRKQWEVDNPSEGERDPGEGRASVACTLIRSATRVLEFVLHDENDVPLFAVARTFSSWVGSKEFPLGPTRVFYLDMHEERPGYVRVRAGFEPAPAFAGYTENTKRNELVRPVPVPAIGQITPERQATFSRPQFGRLVYLSECAAISIIFSSLFWGVARAEFLKGEPVNTKPSAATPVAESTGKTFSAFALDNTYSSVLQHVRLADTNGFNPDTKTIRVRSAQNAKRLAEVKSFSVSVDNSSCKRMESHCRELLSTVQREVKSNLSSLNVPVLNLDQAKVGMESAKLVVSYNPINLLHGQIHLTLYDQEGALWNGIDNVSYAELTAPEVIKTYCEEASSEIVWEIIMAKAHVNSSHEVKETGSTNSE